MKKTKKHIEKGVSYNYEFWEFLNYFLRQEFKKIYQNFGFIYPLKVENKFNFTKDKIADFGIIESIVVCNEENKEIVYSADVILGKKLVKVYFNISKLDLISSFPKKDVSGCIHIDKLNSKMIIDLR